MTIRDEVVSRELLESEANEANETNETNEAKEQSGEQ